MNELELARIIKNEIFFHTASRNSAPGLKRRFPVIVLYISCFFILVRVPVDKILPL